MTDNSFGTGTFLLCNPHNRKVPVPKLLSVTKLLSECRVFQVAFDDVKVIWLELNVLVCFDIELGLVPV